MVKDHVPSSHDIKCHVYSMYTVYCKAKRTLQIKKKPRFYSRIIQILSYRTSDLLSNLLHQQIYYTSALTNILTLLRR